MEKQTKSKRKYRKYDSNFKSDAVKQLKGGRSAKELSQFLGVSEGLLYKWKSDNSGVNREQSQEVKRLKREMRRLEEENEILKKALSIFSRSG